MKRLLNKNYEVDILDSSGYSALHYASRAGYLEIVQYLHGEKKANLNLVTKSGRSTPLHRAAQQGHTRIVTYLLDNGADVQITDADGCTALHRSAERGHLSTCQILIDRHPELVNIRDKRYRLPTDFSPALKELVQFP